MQINFAKIFKEKKKTIQTDGEICHVLGLEESTL